MWAASGPRAALLAAASCELPAADVSVLHHAPEGARNATLVLDVGKTRAKLLLLDGAGAPRWQANVDNESMAVADGASGEPGYLALGIDRLADWLDASLARVGRELRGAPASEQPRRLITTTHGAAFVPLGEGGALLPALDYEWDGYGAVTRGFEESLANFGHHGTPRLPFGLNAGRQLDWLTRRHASRLAALRCWVPYPQYWAWWFCGVVASEVSSLGCHTGLWSPSAARFSDWAQASGLAARFAPLQRAWEVLGRIRPEQAARWGLPVDLQVLAGAHDSNACLARHLHSHPDAVVVSSGTWTVVMALGAASHRLQPERDELVNVAVDGRPVPTARFMGGREFAVLCGGADAALATTAALRKLLAGGWWASPSWSTAGGPFAGRLGRVMQGERTLAAGLDAVPSRLRPALASLYCARMCALLVDELRSPGALVIVEGPFAHNDAFCAALAAHLGDTGVLMRCTDAVEGTARGAWLLAHWAEHSAAAALPPLKPPPHLDDDLRQALHEDERRWQAGQAAVASARA